MTLAQIKPEPKRDANDAGDIIPCPENTANDFTRQLNYERRYSPELEDILYWQIKHLQETGERLQEENQELQRLVASIPSASEFLKQYTSKNNNTDTLQQQQHLQRIPAQRTKLDRKQQRQQQRRQQQQQPQQRQQQSRTLLAVFLGFSFFSQVPFVKKSLTLNHSSCFQDDSADVSPSTTRSSKPGTNTININDTWSMIRTTVVFLCIFHIGLPLLRGLFAVNKQDDEIDAAADSPTAQPTAKHELIPRDIFHLSCQILKETICWLLWNCLCSKSKTTTTNTGIPQQQQDTSEIDQWTQVVEHECMKNPQTSNRLSAFYVCIHTLNMTRYNTDKNAHTYRLFATAALIASLALPWPFCTLRHSLWRCALADKHHPPWMDDIVPCIRNSPDSSIPPSSWTWQKTLKMIQAGAYPGAQPFTVLHTLYTLGQLKSQFTALIMSLTDISTDQDTCELFKFESICHDSSVTTMPFVPWLASVGATVAALWRQDERTALQWISARLKSTPFTPSHLEAHIDFLLAKKMVLLLSGSARQNRRQLQEAQEIQTSLKRMLTHKQRDIMFGARPQSTVMALAEFVVCYTALLAWIAVWDVEEARDATLRLRRMLGSRAFQDIPNTQILIHRLTRLGEFLSNIDYDIDSDSNEDMALEILKGIA